jgi:hypothetical protein
MPDLASAAMRNLLAAFDRRLAKLERYAASGRFTPYTPTFTSTGTAVNLGTGGLTAGAYARSGNLVYARGFIAFGTAGVAAGTGNYQIGLPYKATTSAAAVSTMQAGHWRNSNSPAGGTVNHANDIIIAAGSQVMTARYPATWPTGADTTVGAAAPWAWTINYRIQFWVIYEAAE